jgi:hypothetical protein
MIGNGGFGDVFIQDTFQPLFQYYLQVEEKTDITLTSAVSVDDEVINLSAGHGFALSKDQLITIVEGDLFEQAFITEINVGTDPNKIRMSIPSANAFTTNAKVIRGNKNLKVVGSVATPIDALFKFYDQANTFVPIDITKVKITMAHAAVGDDGKFGGIAELSNGGFYFRRINATRVNLGNYINNQAFKDFGAEVKYPDKGPSGTNSTEITFDMKNIFGQVLRLNPQHDDQVCGVVRNDLSTRTNFYISMIGSFTEGEA